MTTQLHLKTDYQAVRAQLEQAFSRNLAKVEDASNRIEGRIMMDMYEQEVNGMNVVEPKDDFLNRSYGGHMTVEALIKSGKENG
tara:strand:+ start:544 stop:795 length:252 start_codon:yes stop_codon:yes gene_type:complete